MKALPMRKLAALSVCVIVAALFSACAETPEEPVIRDVITRHFTEKGYRVITLDIGSITPLEEGSKRYMGSESCRAEIVTLRLQIQEDAGGPWNFSKGQIVTAEKASVMLIRNRESGRWSVHTVTGVPVR
ncbi:MAG TPA: hypothetical protein VN260_08280 [Dissulfurispiraceae bacterium]|nr:hypothetical protein [Dissulfurispiraceae bacterium]